MRRRHGRREHARPERVRRRSALLVAWLAAATLLAACGRDVEAEPSFGQVERNESLTAANLTIVTDGEGNGVLVGTIINNAPETDMLTDVRVRGEIAELPVDVLLVRGPVSLPTQEPVRLADDPAVLVDAERLRVGFRAPIRLVFARSTTIETTVTVEAQTGIYADIEVPAMPDASPAAS